MYIKRNQYILALLTSHAQKGGEQQMGPETRAVMTQ